MSMKLDTATTFGINNCQINLYPFQATCVEWMKYIEYNVGNPNLPAGGVLGNDMGMGKTPTSTVFAVSTPLPSTLIMTTPSTRYEWVKNFILSGYNANIYTIDDGKVYRCTMEKDIEGAYVIGRHVLSAKKGEVFLEPAVMVCNYQLITSGKVNDKIITERVWWRIIVDEAAYLRTQNPSWHKLDALKQPTMNTPYGTIRIGTRWCVTGTPIQNGGKIDLVNIFRWIDNRFLRGKTEREWDNELKNLICTSLYRINRDQVTDEMKKLMEYPEHEPIVETVNIKLPDSECSRWLETVTYEQLVQICSVRDQQAMNIMNMIMSDEKCFMLAKFIEAKSRNSDAVAGALLENGELRGMASYAYVNIPDFINHFMGSNTTYTGRMSKLDKLREMLMTGNSFVCFHHFENIGIEISRSIRNEFPNYTVLEINGSVTSDLVRHNIVEKANNLIKNGRSVILVSSTKATAEGMNYQAFNRIIIFDHEYNQKTDEQAKSRVQRIGQKNQVYVYEFTLEDFNTRYGVISVDRHIQEIRDSRKHLSDIIDTYNAAFTFRRYTCPVHDQVTGQVRRESGIYFGDYWEKEMKGKLGGVDTVGPTYVH